MSNYYDTLSNVIFITKVGVVSMLAFNPVYTLSAISYLGYYNVFGLFIVSKLI